MAIVGMYEARQSLLCAESPPSLCGSSAKSGSPPFHFEVVWVKLGIFIMAYLEIVD